MIAQAIQVSVLAMGVIFAVLSILIVVIRVLDSLVPYQAPPPSPAPKSSQTSAGPDDGEHVAIIQTVLAHHLGRNPQDISITRIQPQ